MATTRALDVTRGLATLPAPADRRCAESATSGAHRARGGAGWVDSPPPWSPSCRPAAAHLAQTKEAKLSDIPEVLSSLSTTPAAASWPPPFSTNYAKAASMSARPPGGSDQPGRERSHGLIGHRPVPRAPPATHRPGR